MTLDGLKENKIYNFEVRFYHSTHCVVRNVNKINGNDDVRVDVAKDYKHVDDNCDADDGDLVMKMTVMTIVVVMMIMSMLTKSTAMMIIMITMVMVIMTILM